MPMDGIDGTRRLAADLGKAAAAATKLARIAVQKSALDLQAIAQGIVPVDTGNLKNSIDTELAGLSAFIGPTANYGAFIEFGTHKMAPRPYMTPATDAVEPTFIEAIASIGDRTLGA